MSKSLLLPVNSYEDEAYSCNIKKLLLVLLKLTNTNG